MNNLDAQILREMDLSIKQAEAINYALRKVYEALEPPMTETERAVRNDRDSYGGTRADG